MNDDLTTELRRQLAAQADDWQGAPLTLDGVRGRARTIRRRRHATVAGVTAAVVLAVAIPMGVALGGRTDSEIQPAPPGPSEVVDTANPVVPGSELGVPYVEDGVLSLPTNAELLLGEQVTGGSVVGGTVFVLQGDRLLQVDADGGVVDSINITEAGIATSPDQSTIAYIRTGDQQLVVEDGAGVITELGVREDIAELVSVVGTTVWFNRGTDGFDVAQNGGPVVQRPKGRSITDVAPNGRVSVVTSVDLTAGGACSAVVDGSTTVHQSCDYTYGRFSPDGEHQSAHPSYRSGIGDTFVAILDTEGEETARWEAARGDFIRSSTWEDPEHLLVTTYSYDEGWSVIRLGVDGSREVALGPDDANDDVTPSYVVFGAS